MARQWFSQREKRNSTVGSLRSEKAYSVSHQARTTEEPHRGPVQFAFPSDESLSHPPSKSPGSRWCGSQRYLVAIFNFKLKPRAHPWRRDGKESSTGIPHSKRYPVGEGLICHGSDHTINSAKGQKSERGLDAAAGRRKK